MLIAVLSHGVSDISFLKVLGNLVAISVAHPLVSQALTRISRNSVSDSGSCTSFIAVVAGIR